MAKGPLAWLPPARLALPTTLALALAAAGAWMAALATAWTRWNALALGPICGEAKGLLSLPGHCAACPLALTLTAALTLSLVSARRETQPPSARPDGALSTFPLSKREEISRHASAGSRAANGETTAMARAT
jgi:hypothetical protein